MLMDRSHLVFHAMRARLSVLTEPEDGREKGIPNRTTNEANKLRRSHVIVLRQRLSDFLSRRQGNMNEIPIESLRPGTVLRVRSLQFPVVMHWGVVGYGRDAQGHLRVWHSQKSDTLRCTGFEEFSAGQSCEILRVPANPEEAHRVIQRLRSKKGLRWHLTQANCEMVVRWAVEGRAVSHQLGFGALAVIGIVAVVAIASSGD
jgi:hypothetical protein